MIPPGIYGEGEVHNFSDSLVIETNNVSSHNESIMDIEIDFNSSFTPKSQHIRITSHQKHRLSAMDDEN